MQRKNILVLFYYNKNFKLYLKIQKLLHVIVFLTKNYEII